MTIHHHLHEQSDPHLQLEALVQPLPQEQDPERSNVIIQGFFYLLNLEVFLPKMYKFLVEKYKFSIFAYEFFKVKLKNCKLYQKYIIFGSKYF